MTRYPEMVPRFSFLDLNFVAVFLKYIEAPLNTEKNSFAFSAKLSYG
jgi:hypothetical protein